MNTTVAPINWNGFTTVGDESRPLQVFLPSLPPQAVPSIWSGGMCLDERLPMTSLDDILSSVGKARQDINGI